jgi:hypothetical protein
LGAPAHYSAARNSEDYRQEETQDSANQALEISERNDKNGESGVAMKQIAKPARTESPSQQLEGFIAKFDPTVAKLIRSCRLALRKRFPTAIELVYDNYNFFVIGFSATERSSDCIVSLAANAKGVGLSFYYGATLPDPDKILLGNGNQNRFIRLESAALLARLEVEALLRAAVAQAKSPLPATGRGSTIIKSIYSKQRPRRLRAEQACKPNAPVRFSFR